MTPQSAPPVMFEPGTIVDGRYRIVSLIGVGGVGRVYLARHLELDSDVAIKVLRPDMADRPDAVQRFAREARASVRLRSDRIARVLDVGSHEGKPFFVMEYLVGCSLLEARDEPGVDLATLCEFFIQTCEGLADAHAQGVVHRDVKPENLFVVRDASGWRSLKILDFGISKFSLTGRYSDVDVAGMRTEAMMGTPHYISPEQIRASRDVDHRTDIWSLGAVMFEVITGGVLPFREDREVTALVAEVLEQPHRSLLDVAPNTPERLAAIVDRCLVKDRDARYQTVAEVALDLLPLAPVRARASVERAVSVMQAAGLLALNSDLDSLRRWPSSTDVASSSPGRGSPQPLVEVVAPSSGPRRQTLPHPTPMVGSPTPPVTPRGASYPSPPINQVGDIPVTISSATPASSTPPVSVARGASTPAVAPTSDESQLAAESSRKRKGLAALSLLGAVLLSGVFLLTARGGSPEKPPTAAAPPARPASTPSVALAPEPVLDAPIPSATTASVASQASSLPSAKAPAAPSAKKAGKVSWSPRPAPAPAAPTPPVKSVESPASPPKLELRRER